MNSRLFSSYTLGPTTLSNRIVMAPMTRGRADERGVPTDLMVEYYRQRATAGLIITEACPVSPLGVGLPGSPGIYTSEQAGGWSRVTEAVHSEGGKIFLQLAHAGRVSHPSLNSEGLQPVGPSSLAADGSLLTRAGMQPFVAPRPLLTEEVPEVVEEFQIASKHALEAGFDGVELLAAHGNLIDQFMADGVNRRKDLYGGSLKNRLRLLLEVTEMVSAIWGASRVGVRLSPGSCFHDMRDSNPAGTCGEAARLLKRFQPAYLHVAEPSEPDQFLVDGKPAVAGVWLRNRFKGPIITAHCQTRESAEQALQEGWAELIAFGRLFLANPDLPERLKRGAPLQEAEISTYFVGGSHGYTDYQPLSG